MNQGIQRYQQRRYVAQLIEILPFNELLLAPCEPVEDGVWSRAAGPFFGRDLSQFRIRRINFLHSEAELQFGALLTGRTFKEILYSLSHYTKNTLER
jgi:hypothetical protein